MVWPTTSVAVEGDRPCLNLRPRFRRRASGQQLWSPTVLDAYSRKCLAIDVAGGIRSSRTTEILTPLISVHGALRYIRSGNGPERVAMAILRWLGKANTETAHIDLRKP